MSTPRIQSVLGKTIKVQYPKPLPPISEYQAWFDGQPHSRGINRNMSRTPQHFRRMAIMRRSGASFTEIANAILWSQNGVQKAYENLPDHLK